MPIPKLLGDLAKRFAYVLGVVGAAGFCMPTELSAAGTAEGSAHVDALRVDDTALLDEFSGSAAFVWATLHGIASVCPNFPQEQARLDKLDRIAQSKGQGSIKLFVEDLERNPKKKVRLTADVQTIIETAGDCDSEALQEWQAGGRQLIDTHTQWLAASPQSVVVNWPSPALLEPIEVSVEGRSRDAQDRQYLKLLLRNSSKTPVGVALSGKELRAGLCSELTSTEVPITRQSYRATRLARLAPGESLHAKVTLSADCFEEDTSALMGTLILETPTGPEYRSIAVLGIRDSR
jgi:hypothetical protein